MKLGVLLSLTLLFTSAVYAQQAPQLSLTFNHLALSVRDVDVSSDFYGKVLNLQEITNKTKTEGVRWFSLGEGKELHLISDVYYKRGTVVTNKAIHLALTTNNFDELLAILDRKKVAYGDWPGTLKKINLREDGIRQIFLQDPDGYWIEVNSVGQQ